MTDQICAFHLDLKTSHYQIQYLEGLFTRLAQSGYTHIVFEIEDKVRLESIKGAEWFEAYSKEEFSALLKKCRAAGLMPIPLIQTLGHVEFLLSHQKYHYLREIPSSAYMLCPSHKKSVPFLCSLVDEVIELFDDPEYIHIGADETHHLGKCPLCKEKVEKSSISELYIEHLNKIARHALSKGSRPIAWADMILQHPNAVESVERDLIWNDWDYAVGDLYPEKQRIWGTGMVDQEKFQELDTELITAYAPFVQDDQKRFRAWCYADFFIDKGFDVLIAPATRCGGDHCFAPAYDHLANMNLASYRMKRSPQPLGMVVTSWALRVNTVESQWPALRIPHIAADNDADTWEKLEPFVLQDMFEDPENDFFRAWEKISPSLSTTHSHLGIGRDTFYVGPSDSILCLLRSWKEKGGLSAAVAQAQEKRHGYIEGEKTLQNCNAKDEYKRSLQFWSYAARVMQVKSDELEYAAKSIDGKKDPKQAGQLLMATEALRDEYRILLSTIYTPGSIERELSLLFGASLRFLERE